MTENEGGGKNGRASPTENTPMFSHQNRISAHGDTSDGR
jgi:hypothetical protein